MNVTTLNITANYIKVLAVRGKSVISREITLPPGSIKNGLILEPKAVGGEIRRLFKAAKISGSRVICAVNGLPFTYRLLAMPELEAASFSEAVLRAARKEMSISPDEMYLSWRAYPGNNNERQVLVTGITRRPVDNLIKALAEAGISPWLMDLPHLALARLASRGDGIIIDFEKDCSNIVMTADGVPCGMHMAPSLAPGASLQDQIAGVTDKLAKMIDFYNSGHPGRPVKEPVKILVTGELLEEPEALDYLRSRSGYPVEILASSSKDFSGLPLNRYAVNAGAMLLAGNVTGSQKGDSALSRYFNLENILRDSRPKTDAVKVLKKVLVPFGLTVGIGVLIISLAARENLMAEIAGLKGELNRANTGLQQKQLAAGNALALEENIDRITSLTNEIEDGKAEIFASREYVDDINAVCACMPEGLTFTSLEIGRETISLSGLASQPTEVLKFADSLEATGIFSQAVITFIDKPYFIDDVRQQLSFMMNISK